jgi:hypothetical protein
VASKKSTGMAAKSMNSINNPLNAAMASNTVTTTSTTNTINTASVYGGSAGATQGMALTNNSYGQSMWQQPLIPNSNWTITTQGTGTMYPGNISITGWPTSGQGIGAYDLSTTGKFTMNLNECESFLTGNLVKIKDLAVTYPLDGKWHSVYVEQDFSDLDLSVITTSDVYKDNFRLSIFTIDRLLNRLEFCAVYKEADPKANLEYLVNSEFSVNPDKTEYLSTLYCRFVPLLHFNVVNAVHKTTGLNSSLSIDFERTLKAGLTPIIHLSHAVFGGLETPKKSDVAKVFENMSTEVMAVRKSDFPKVQPYFSPEYGYLTLNTDIDLFKTSREHTDYSEEGLYTLLNKVCLSGSKTREFANCLMQHIGLDQRIKDTADQAVSDIKRFIEQSYN